MALKQVNFTGLESVLSRTENHVSYPVIDNFTLRASAANKTLSFMIDTASV